MNPANLFTLARLALAPFILQAVLNRRYFLALSLFAGAAVTDVLDGVLARRFGWLTKAGAYLDPIADKVLLSGLYLSLAAVGCVPWWLVGVIFGRDMFVLASSVLALCFTKLREFQPSVWGKITTFFQILTAVAWMARNVADVTALDTLAALLVWPTAAVTIWSGIHYGWRGLRRVRTH